MKETFHISLAASVLSAVLMTIVGAYGSIDLVFAQGPPKFTINLTGGEEVPPVQTNATVRLRSPLLTFHLTRYPTV